MKFLVTTLILGCTLTFGLNALNAAVTTVKAQQVAQTKTIDLVLAQR